MDENLVGYLLQALDPDTHQKVEVYLQTNPEAQRRLELLRGALEPLAADQEPPEVPAGLWVRTLGRVSEYQCHRLIPQAPRPSGRAAGSVRPWYRRADLLVAASILLCLGLLVPPALYKVRAQYDRAACAENLRAMGASLTSYREQRGSFPNPALQEPPFNVAGFVVPMLREEGMPPATDLRCPADGSEHSGTWRASELKARGPDQFPQFAPHLLGCYSYTLGYQHPSGGIATYGPGDGMVPIMADSPPRSGAQLCGRNSDNHGGNGQNVLFSDNHVEWLTNRIWNNDDIFLNREHAIAPGLDREDFVLGASETPVRMK